MSREPADEPSTPALRLVDADLSGRLHGLCLTVHQGECAVVVGPNGAGKSSLLRVLAGLERLERGSFELFGDPAPEQATRARLVSWLPQRPRLIDGLTSDELVATGRFRFHESPERALAKAREVMVTAGAGDLVGRAIDRISGGELQRVLISTLVAQDTPVLLVDEPANHLDPKHQVATYQRFGDLAQERARTIVLVTHDIRLARLLGPRQGVRVLGMAEGRLHFDLCLDSPELAEALTELYGVPFLPKSSEAALAVDLEHYHPKDQTGD